MSETAYITQVVPGHDPVTEHVEGGWRLTCSCSELGELHDSPEAASADRFAHEDEIGMRVEVDRKSGNPVA